MFSNYLKTAARSLLMDKVVSIVNVVGLAVGVACFVFIALWVWHELSYDRFHPHADRLYRLAVDNKAEGAIQRYAVSSAPMAVTMAREFPEVEKAVRFTTTGPTLRNPEKNQSFRGDAFAFVNPGVVEVFAIKFIAGDPESALDAPNSVVLTQEMAEKYFGRSDPLGKRLQFTGRVMTVSDERDYQVTGVIENFPENMHRDFDFLASDATLSQIAPQIIQNWDWYFSYSYVRLQEGVSPAVVESKLPDLVQRYMPEETASKTRIWLQPVTDIHLHSNLLFDSPNGDITNVYLFSAIAILIILIACVNFMNLSTARALKRSKEVGIKKVLGAARKQLIYQFLTEAVITSLLSIVLAVGLIELLLPQFNLLSQKTLQVHYWGSDSILPALVALVIVLGLLAGSYPAFFLSAFKPVKVLQGASGKTTGGSAGHAGFRKGLIVFQFVISIVLVFATQVVHNQLEYVRNRKLGFDKEHVAWFVGVQSRHGFNYDTFRNTLLAHPGIIKVAQSSGLPVGQTIRYDYRSDAMTADALSLISTYSVDHDYADLLGLQMAAGRFFSNEFGTDSSAFVVNESAAAEFGWPDAKQAIGQQLRREDGLAGPIIGVVRNFNFTSLRQEIAPLVLSHDPGAFNVAFVKLRGGDIPATLDFIEKTYREFLPEQPYQMSFLDQTLNNMYQSEMQLGQLFRYFAFLAIMIACMGLFGLSSFSAAQHTKEIGVRKVLGATVPGILLLLSREFTRLVAIAFILGAPLGYFLMERWLSDFAYRIEMPLLAFVLAGGLTLVVALISVSYNAIRAALTNPVEALRYE